MLDRSHYYTYGEISDKLNGWVDQFPELCALSSVGTTVEGREQLLMTITDPATGTDESKPALWVDGNTHAGEVTGCTAALDFIATVLAGYAAGKPMFTRLLRSSTCYVLPCICPDGVELYLTTPLTCRSTPRVWPDVPPPERSGFRQADIDGDGEITMMRIKDRGGSFKLSQSDPRLMVPRLPEEEDDDTDYYHLLPEGLFDNWDGERTGANSGFGYDANRQYPRGYVPDAMQPGAGPVPMALVEVENVVKAMTARKNICISFSYHTTGREILHVCDTSSAVMSADDKLRTMALVDRCCEVTGYGVRPRLSGGGNGHSLSWGYEHRGHVAFIQEMWNVFDAAGIDAPGYLSDGPREGSLAEASRVTQLLRWCDATLPEGSYFKDWAPCTHPQLGALEVGGFYYKRLTQNPPPSMLRAEVARNTDFALVLARSLPRLQLAASCEPAGPSGLTELTVRLKNTGFLGTAGTDRAVDAKAVLGAIVVTLDCGAGIQLEGGSSHTETPHLAGRSVGDSALLGTQQEGAAARNEFGADKQSATLRWLLSGTGQVRVAVDAARGGVHHVSMDVAAPSSASL